MGEENRKLIAVKLEVGDIKRPRCDFVGFSITVSTSFLFS